MAIIDVTKDNFEAVVTRSEKPILADFWAPWCGYCRRLNPIVDTLAADDEALFQMVKINVDDAADLKDQYGVQSIPTLILFKNGVPSEPLVAPKSKMTIDNWLKDLGVL